MKGVKRSGGYTILEVLLTISILAVSFTFLFPSLFRSADQLRYLSQKFTASSILQNEFTEAKLHFKSTLSFDAWEKDKQGTYNGFQYRITTESEKVDPAGSVQKVSMTISWAGNSRSMSGTVYVLQ